MALLAPASDSPIDSVSPANLKPVENVAVTLVLDKIEIWSTGFDLLGEATVYLNRKTPRDFACSTTPRRHWDSPALSRSGRPAL